MTLRIAAVVEQSWHRVPGGTATSTTRTLEAVARVSDVEVQGVAAWHRGQAHEFVAPPVPVRHVPLPRRVLYDSWHYFDRPLVQRVCGPVDVVHATGGVVPPSGDAALVVTLHDLAFMHRPEQFTPRGVRFQMKALARAREHADVVICPSQTSAADCEANGIDGDRIRVIPWGVDIGSVSAADREAVREKHALPERFILWVGTLEPRKNLPRLVAAVQALDVDVPLVIVGPTGWGDVANSLEAHSVDLRWLGFVSTEDLSVLYDAASVFCYPSLLEGFGMPVLDAMAHRTPVVTSAGTATEEVVGDGGLVVDPENVSEISQAIERLLTDEAFADSCADAGLDRARTFTWERTASETVRAYEHARSTRTR